MPGIMQGMKLMGNSFGGHFGHGTHGGFGQMSTSHFLSGNGHHMASQLNHQMQHITSKLSKRRLLSYSVDGTEFDEGLALELSMVLLNLVTVIGTRWLWTHNVVCRLMSVQKFMRFVSIFKLYR